MLLRQAAPASFTNPLLLLLAAYPSLLLAAARPQIGFQQSENRFPSQVQENRFQNRPAQFEADPMQDFRSGIDDLANGARTTAFLIEEGGPAGVDILSQFGELLGKLPQHILEVPTSFLSRKREQPGFAENPRGASICELFRAQLSHL